MSNEPMISVIVPVYNAEKYLRKCVDSIVDQTYRKLEIILVDDGSQDNSGMICDEYAQRDERVKVIHKENGGPASARNEGIKAATGDYVAFVDSDDWLDVNLYTDCILRMEYGTDVLLFGLKNVDIDGSNEVVIRPEMSEINISDSDKQKLFYVTKNSLLGYPWNKLLKRTIIGRTRFLDVGIREDLCFTFEIINKIKCIQCADVYGYNYVRRESSILHSSNVNNVSDLLRVDKVLQNGIKALNKKNNLVLYNIIMQTVCVDILLKDILRNEQISRNKKIELINSLVNNKAMVHRLKLRLCSNKLYFFAIFCLKLRLSKLLLLLAKNNR